MAEIPGFAIELKLQNSFIGKPCQFLLCKKLVKIGVQIALMYNTYKFCEAKLGRFDRLLQNCRLIQRRNASAIHYFPPEKYNLYRYAHTRTCVGAFCFGINLCFGNNPAKRPSLRSKLVAERRLNYHCKANYMRSVKTLQTDL